MRQISFFHHENIFIAVIFSQNTLNVLCPLADAVVHRGEHGCLFRVVCVFDQLLVIVNGHNGDDRTGFVILLPQRNQLGAVQPVQRHQHAGAAVHRTHARTNHHVILIADFDLGRIHGFIIHQPRRIKSRNNILQRLFKHAVVHVIHRMKLLITPDNLSVSDHTNRNRHWNVNKILSRLIVGSAGQSFQILQHLLIAAPHGYNIIDIQSGTDCHLKQGQKQRKKSAHTGEHQEHDKIHTESRLQNSGQSLIQNVQPPFRFLVNRKTMMTHCHQYILHYSKTRPILQSSCVNLTIRKVQESHQFPCTVLVSSVFSCFFAA